MKLKINYLINNTFIISLFNKSMGFLSVLIMYKIFDKSIVGEFNIYTTYISLFFSIVLLGSEQSLLKKIIHKDLDSFYDSFNSYFIIILLISSIAFGLMFILSISDYFKLLFIILGTFLIVERYFEMFSKYKNQYNIFLKNQSLIMIIGVLFYITYPFLFDTIDSMFFLIFVKIVGLIIILLTIFKYIKNIINMINLNSIFLKISTTVKHDKQFIFLLLVSTLVVHADKVIISLIVNHEEFADFSLLMSFIMLIYSVKVLFSNKYIYLIKRSNYYIKKTRMDSFTYTLIMGTISFIVYFIVTKYYLINYSFLYIPFLIVFLFILLESSFGAAGSVISYMHKPIVNAYYEILSLIFISIFIGIYFLYFQNKIDEITYFLVVSFFVKCVMGYLKLNYIKKRKLI